MIAGLPRPEDAVAATARLADHAPITDLIPWPRLSARLGAEVRVKRDDALPGGAMFRGAVNAVLAASSGALTQDLIAASTGPLGAAVVEMAARLSVRATIILPEDAPDFTDPRARILRVPGALADARAAAVARAHAEGLRMIDGASAEAMAGAATSALECLGQWPELDAMTAPAASGAFCAGLALGLRGARSTARLVAAVPQACPSLRASLEGARPIAAPCAPSRATVLRASVTPEAPGAFVILSRTMDSFTDLNEDEIVAAEAFLRGGDAPEGLNPGAGTLLPLAALLHRDRDLFGARVVMIATGG
jgi:threonine dehydratase